MSEETNRTSQPLSYSPGRRRDLVGEARHWARRTFRRENIWAAFKTFSWVAPLTILIWIYAEREQVVEIRDAIIPIEVKSSNPSRVITLRPGDQSITAKIIGPNAAAQQVAEIVRRAGDQPAVQVEVNLPPGQHTVYTSQLLGDYPLFKTRGVAIGDPKPSVLQITVDELVERDVKVHAPTDVQNLTGPPIFVPDTVKVRGPRSALDNASGVPVTVTANLMGRDELRTPGLHEIAAVPLVASVEHPSVDIIPKTVKATIDVRQADAKYVIRSIPVWPWSQPGVLDEWKPEYNQFLNNVTVSGPQEKIDLLQKESFVPIAMLRITQDDRDKPQSTRTVKLDLPEGVTVVKEDQEKLNVSFKLVKRTAEQ